MCVVKPQQLVFISSWRLLLVMLNSKICKVYSGEWSATCDAVQACLKLILYHVFESYTLIVYSQKGSVPDF